MKFELEDRLRGASNEELLDDLRHSAKAIGRETITIAQYEVHGRTHPTTIQRRFGSWPKALELAGLMPSRSKIGITDDELFENVKSLWMSLGRQPRYSEVKAPDSRFSAGTYENRFGSWKGTLKAFVAWVNSDSGSDLKEIAKLAPATGQSLPQAALIKRRTRREITDRQRFRILIRDGFRCRACGVSPLTSIGTVLHVDHVLPWSKGGETVDENLETKCTHCNLGKGNAFDL